MTSGDDFDRRLDSALRGIVEGEPRFRWSEAPSARPAFATRGALLAAASAVVMLGVLSFMALRDDSRDAAPGVRSTEVATPVVSPAPPETEAVSRASVDRERPPRASRVAPAPAPVYRSLAEELPPLENDELRIGELAFRDTGVAGLSVDPITIAPLSDPDPRAGGASDPPMNLESMNELSTKEKP